MDTNITHLRLKLSSDVPSGQSTNFLFLRSCENSTRMRSTTLTSSGFSNMKSLEKPLLQLQPMEALAAITESAPKYLQSPFLILSSSSTRLSRFPINDKKAADDLSGITTFPVHQNGSGSVQIQISNYKKKRKEAKNIKGNKLTSQEIPEQQTNILITGDKVQPLLNLGPEPGHRSPYRAQTLLHQDGHKYKPSPLEAFLRRPFGAVHELPLLEVMRKQHANEVNDANLLRGYSSSRGSAIVSNGSSKAHATTLITKMVTLKYSGSNGVREHILRMNDMASQLKGLDMEISEGFLVHFIMTSLPAQFGSFKINYNTQKEKWKTSELISMCVQEEERLKSEQPDRLTLPYGPSKGKGKKFGKGNVQGNKNASVTKTDKGFLSVKKLNKGDRNVLEALAAMTESAGKWLPSPFLMLSSSFTLLSRFPTSDKKVADDLSGITTFPVHHNGSEVA
ncbi:hypothetical protein RJ639_038861 [Escallonia herrerae]|uniref:Uncharacterized protein n=1 Tax=Escallonia herrerae TaxID=1293975 RepID=A0AA88WMS4_9ASTE|nr:hypothetical protein RJ639_038861 [Escallonia herrerae]